MPSLLRSSLWGPIKVPRRSEIIQQLGDECNQTGTILGKRGAVDAPFQIVMRGWMRVELFETSIPLGVLQ